MADRLTRARALAVGVTALLLFQTTNQVPVVAAAQPTRDGVLVGRINGPDPEVGAVPVRQRTGGGSNVNTGGVGADVQPRPRFAPYLKPSLATEVPELRGARRTVVANPNGTFTATLTQQKVNYLDNQGLWEPIDRRLVASTDPSYDLKEAANGFDLAVSDAHGGSGAVALTSDGLTLKLRLPGYGAAANPAPTPSASPSPEPSASPSAEPTASIAPQEPVPSPSTAQPAPASAFPSVVPAPPSPSLLPAASTAPDPSNDGSASAAPSPSAVTSSEPSITPMPSAPVLPSSSPTESPTAPPEQSVDITSVTYPGAAGQPDATVGSTDEGFEFGAVFHNPSDPPAFNVVVDLGRLAAALAPDGQTVDLTETTTGDGQGASTNPVGHISIPGLHDAAGVGATGADITVRVSPAGATTLPDGVPADLVAGLSPTEVVLSYLIAPTYLADPLRVFPVTLDPTVCISRSVSGCTSGAFDHFIGSGIATTYPTGWTTFRVGYESRGLGYGTMRGLMYFPDVALPDGAEVTDTDLQLHISSEYGSPSGELMHVDRVTRGWSQTSTWNDMTIPTSGWTGTGASADVTVPASGLMHFDPDGIVRQWYTRRSQDWQPDYGFMIKMNSEGSTHGEVEFDRYNDASDSNKPKLTITYVQPHTTIDFDSNLGATYAPSSMVIGQTAKLPIVVTNNGSGFTLNHCLNATTSDCYQIGYRWFNAKGTLVASQTFDLSADITTGSHLGPFGLVVTPPPGTAMAQDTLRLDLVHRIGGSTGIYLYASDWALPSLYYSRNKKVLTTDSTRWVGSSYIERDEFGITLVPGAGSSQGSLQSVGLSDGGSAGINLWSGDMHYEGAGGVGFKDLSDVALSYGYDSANVGADCPAGFTNVPGILGACGWYTNYDERLTPAATAGDYVYQGPSGNRYYVGRDADGQLTSSAPIWLERPRVTIADETAPATGTTALWTTTQHFTGAGSLAAANNVIIDSGVPVPVQPHLQDYPLLRFAIKTSVANATMAGIRFKIHDLTDTSKADVWLVYTVGNTGHTWSTGLAQVDLTDAFTPGGGWTETAARNLFGDARTAIGSATYDDLTVLNFQIEGNTSLPAGNTTWVDSVRLEPERSVYTSNGQSAWTANSQSGTSTDHWTDPLITLTTSAKITPTTIAASPDCVGCTGAGGGLGLLPFVSWQWKKVGGTSIATVLHLKDARQGYHFPKYKISFPLSALFL